MKPLRFYREAYRSITDFGFYAEILQQPLHRTVQYTLYLVAHVALIYTISAAVYQLPWVYEGIQWAQQNFPTLVFEDGWLSIPEADTEEPIVREYLGQSLWTYVFDPEGDEDPYKVRRPAVVINPEKCLLIIDSDFQMSWAWRDVVQSTTVDTQAWLELERQLRNYFWPFSFTVLFLFYLVVKPFQASLISFFSAIAAVRMGVRMPFSYHLTICLYALTPAIAIDLLLQLVNVLDFSDFLPIYMATAAIYAYRATQSALSPE